MCIVREADGTYKRTSKSGYKLVEEIKNQWYIDIEEFQTLGAGQSPYNFKRICDILNQAVKEKDLLDQPSQMYIADDELEQNERKSRWLNRMQIVCVPGYKPLICYTLKAEQGVLEVPEPQRYLFLRGLGGFILGCSYNGYYKTKKAKRYAIPALKGYETIAVKNISYYIGHPDNLRTAWIVSPFVRETLEAYEKLKPSKETFAEQVLNAQNFSWVVDWVQKNHLGDTTPTQAEITCCYRKLIYAYCEALEKTKSNKAEHKPNDPGECV